MAEPRRDFGVEKMLQVLTLSWIRVLIGFKYHIIKVLLTAYSTPASGYYTV
jgi:hypothetical protein